MNYREVDAANEQLDQDFRLDDIDADDREEAEEAAERKDEYSRIVLHLMSSGLHLHDLAGIAARIMHEWTQEEGAYYKDKKGNVSLFYRNFEIKHFDGHWFLEWQSDQTFNFWDVDLMNALKAIDDIISMGELV